MGTDYRVDVRRKSDKKVLGTFDANCLKSIMDSGFGEQMHLNGRSSDNVTFTYDDVEAVEEAAWKAVGEHYAKIIEKKLMIPMSANEKIKYELEEDIRYEQDEITGDCGLRYVIEACAFLRGEIDCVTESLYHKVDSAVAKEVDGSEPDDAEAKETWISSYKWNGLDLPKTKGKWGNGEEYEMTTYVMDNDIECVVHADY